MHVYVGQSHKKYKFLIFFSIGDRRTEWQLNVDKQDAGICPRLTNESFIFTSECLIEFKDH